MKFISGTPLEKLIKADPKRIDYQFTPEDHYEEISGGYPNCYSAMVIPPGMFTEEEIEELRRDDAHDYEFGYGHTIANFLPDHLRPADVEKM